MFSDLKKELSSIKILIILLSIAISIYLLRFVLEFLTNFSDILLIFVFGWLFSFILEPVVDLFTKYAKIPKPIATPIVFVLVGIFITLGFFLFIPDVASQLQSLQKILPGLLNNAPPFLKQGIDNFLNSFTNYIDIIPSITQFAVNLVIVLILSFYLIIEKDSLNRKLYAIIPKSWHENVRFFQKVVDKTFASFVRVQIIWGITGGLVTYIVLLAFGVNYAASTSFLAGILTAVPMIGPIIGVIPPLLVALISDPQKAVIIFLIIFLIQQFIFNVIGPKIIGRAFQINPIMVMLALLIGIKIAGFTGAIFAVPVVSILLVVGKEFYSYYFKEED